MNGRSVWIASRAAIAAETGTSESSLPPQAEGLECAIAVDGRPAAIYRFRDEPRIESRSFIAHLHAKHRVKM